MVAGYQTRNDEPEFRLPLGALLLFYCRKLNCATLQGVYQYHACKYIICSVFAQVICEGWLYILQQTQSPSSLTGVVGGVAE